MWTCVVIHSRAQTFVGKGCFWGRLYWDMSAVDWLIYLMWLARWQHMAILPLGTVNAATCFVLSLFNIHCRWCLKCLCHMFLCRLTCDCRSGYYWLCHSIEHCWWESNSWSLSVWIHWSTAMMITTKVPLLKWMWWIIAVWFLLGTSPVYYILWLIWKCATLAFPRWVYEFGDDFLYSLYQRTVLFFCQYCSGVEVSKEFAFKNTTGMWNIPVSLALPYSACSLGMQIMYIWLMLFLVGKHFCISVQWLR